MRTLLVSLLSFLTVFGGEIHKERIWTGRNGKNFRGIFLQLIDEDRRVRIASSSGQIFTIDLDNLSIPDRQLILDTKAPAPPTEPDKRPNGEEAEVAPGFKKPPVMPRNTIMPTTPEAVGSRKSDELLDPMWQFIGWWDTERVLPIPRDGDFDDRLEWAHERLARYCRVRTGGSVLDVESLREGLEKYFEEHLKNLATITVREDTDFSPAALKRYATGMNAVLLRVTMTYANGRDFRTCAAVESIDEQGNAVLHLWGQRKNAKIELEKRRPPGSHSRSISGANNSYRITLADLDDLPDFVTDNEAKFFLDPEKYDTVVIAKPYLFAKEGMVRPIPPVDPLFEPARPGQEKLQPTPGAGRITLPIDFRSDFTNSRLWRFRDGSTFEGKLGFNKDQQPELRDTSGKSRDLEVEDLTPEDQASFYLTSGCSGAAAKPPRLELRYHLDTQHGEDYDFVITTEGSLGRIDFPTTKSSLTFDLKDQAYVATKSRRSYLGRWEAHGLVPRQRFAGVDEQEEHQNFSAIVRAARPSQDFSFPARFATFPASAKSFSHPRVEFCLIHEPTVMVAIYQVLNASSPASRDPNNPKAPNRKPIIVFSQGTEVSNHSGLRDIASRFMDHYMLPLRLRWTNAVNTSWVSREDQLKASGQFSLSLTSATVPETFPDGHFRIPEEARKAEIGTCIEAKQ